MTIVETDAGAVAGQQMDGYTAWRGVPYAAAPVGALRFRPPQPCTPWPGVRDGSLWGACAPQVAEGRASLGPTPGGTPGSSEDCLFLNVTAPADGRTGLPVLVWLHGGGYAAGWGAAHVGDGETYARRGVVCVTVNYRLNALGFLDLGHLLGEDYALSGSVGILDQVAALEWVQRNVAAFGGDPERVTVAGVSAGAKSVATLMGSPLARGLFARAVSQSGGGDHVAAPEVGAAVTQLLLDTLAVAPEDLLTLDAQLLAETASALMGPLHRGTWLWRPTVDGVVVPDVPTRSVAAGSAAGVALLAGSNTREAGLFALVDPAGPARALEVLTDGLGADAAAALVADHRSRRDDDAEADLALMTEERYGVPTLRILDAQASHGPTFRYLFDGLAPGAPAVMRGVHGSEVAFVFGLGPTSPLAAQMQDAWHAFVSTGDPGWPAYDAAVRTTTVLDDEAHPVDDPFGADRLGWGDATWASGTWHAVPAGHV